MSEGSIWELQWHPARGGRVRRILLDRRRRRRWGVVAGLVGAVVLTLLALLPFGLRVVVTRLAIHSLARENRQLHASLQRGGSEGKEIAARLMGRVQAARRLAWMFGNVAGARDPLGAFPADPEDSVALSEWLETVSTRMLELATAITVGAPRPPCPIESLPTRSPVDPQAAVPVATFGWRTSPFTGKEEAHHGVTLAAPRGQPVVAPGAARVAFAGTVRNRHSNEWTRLGTIAVLDHGGGVFTVVGGLDSCTVRRGQRVARGDQIGTVGQSAWTRVPAVYYEVRWPIGGGTPPIDPALVDLALRPHDLEGRFTDPTGGLPEDYASLAHLIGRTP